MKIELPETFSIPVPTLGGGEKKPEPIPLGFTGHIVVPDAWTLGNYEDYHAAGVRDDGEMTRWERMWKWAGNLIDEWAIEGLPTNPRKIDDNEHLTWVLMSFLANAVIVSMFNYVEDEKAILKAKKSVDFPAPENLKPGEFLAWHKAQNKAAEDKSTSQLLKAWLAGSVLVRQWPNGTDPKKWRQVDLRLAFAMDELLAETILPSMNLGNWSARPGVA